MKSARGSNLGFRSAALAALVAVVWLESGTSLHAQTTSASVFGSVQDSQGGVLPGASVALTSRTQAFTQSQEWQRRQDSVAERTSRVLERRGDFSQSVDSSGNPYP